MKKLLYLIPLILGSLFVKGQTHQQFEQYLGTLQTNNVARNGLRADSTLGVPFRDTTFHYFRPGAILFAHGYFWGWNGNIWRKFTDSGSSTSTGVTTFNARAGDVLPLIGDYSAFYVPLTRTITINGTTFDLSANRTWTIAIPTSSADSLKHLFVDTSANTDGFVLTFDAVNHKWKLTNPSGGGISALNTDVVATGTGAVAATIQPNVVNYSKIQVQPASSLIGNPTGSPANNQAITLGVGLGFTGTTLRAINIPNTSLTNSSITINSVPVALGGSINVSTGSPNSNIGSGYRLAIPGTNNIKTLFKGYGVLLDSTSNPNSITAFVDTSAGKIATQWYAQNAEPDTVAVQNVGGGVSILFTNGNVLSAGRISSTADLNWVKNSDSSMSGTLTNIGTAGTYTWVNTQFNAAGRPIGQTNGAVGLTNYSQVVTNGSGQGTSVALQLHQAVDAATTTVLSAGNVYNNGTLGVNATITNSTNGAIVVDGYTALLNDRILVKNEAAPSHNGIYTVTQVGTVSTPWILTRGPYSSVGVNMAAGSMVYVKNGTVNASTLYAQTTVGTVTFGTTNLVYAQITGGSSSGITTFNTLTAATQTLSLGTTGTDPNWSSVTADHKLNLPDIGAGVNHGLVNNTNQTIPGIKFFSSAPRLVGTSTINYVWTAIDGNGNGSWQASAGGAPTTYASNRDTVTQASHGFTVGKFVSKGLSNWVLADTISNHLDGVVSSVIDVNTFVVTTSGKMDWASGFTVGSWVFQSTTAGTGTLTSPVISDPAGKQTTSTVFTVMIRRPYDFAVSTTLQPPFADNIALIKGSADATKLGVFNVSTNVPTGTTRTFTLQNANYTIAGTDIANTFGSTQIFTNSPRLTTSSTLNYLWTSTGTTGAGSWQAQAVPTWDAVLNAGSTLIGNHTVIIPSASLLYFSSGQFATDGYSPALTSKTVAYTIAAATDNGINVNGQSGGFAVKLPAVGLNHGIYTIERLDNTPANRITIDNNGTNLSGYPVNNSLALTGVNQSVTIQTTNSGNYQVIATNGHTGYYNITSGASSTVPDGYDYTLFNPTTVIAAYNLTFPPNPIDAQELTIHFGGTIAGGAPVVTTLTLTANSGQTFEQDAAPVKGTGGSSYTYRYNSTLGKWFKIGDASASSGSYSPTITGITNIASSTTAICYWTRVGNIVTVNGSIGVTPTGSAVPGGTSSDVQFSLPVASAFTANSDLNGIAAIAASVFTTSPPNINTSITADATNDRAEITFVTYNNGGHTLSFSFSYIVK